MAPEREPATPSRCPSNRGSRMDGNYLILLAESEGFEPPIPLRVLLISNQVPSAARPALRSHRGVPPRPAGKAVGDPTPAPAPLGAAAATWPPCDRGVPPAPPALICSAQQRLVKHVWRRGWDSNPRYVAVYTLSKRAPSAARPPLPITS